MKRVVFLDRATLTPRVILRKPGFVHEWRDYPNTRPDQIIERARGQNIVIVNKVPLDADIIAALPDLEMIAVAATGTDMIDIHAAARAGVVVSNVLNYARASVPEHAFALLLALSRSIGNYRQDVIEGQWQANGLFTFFTHPIHDLAGRRIAIFGSGSLGGRVAEIARAFGMEAVFVGRKGRVCVKEGFVGFDEAIETAEVISLHLPLTETTRHLIGAPEFLRMRGRPILIQTARGGIVDEDALEAALDAGQIRAAGIDVTRPEPPPADSVIMRLARRPNVIVTPHIAWGSDEAQQRLADQLIDNLEAFARRAPVNVVCP